MSDVRNKVVCKWEGEGQGGGTGRRQEDKIGLGRR